MMITYLINECEILLELPHEHDIAINHRLLGTCLEPILICNVWPDFTLDLAMKVRASGSDLHSTGTVREIIYQKNHRPF